MSLDLKSVKPVRRETLQAAVYDQLCELILGGDLAPGESITVGSIAKAFGVSAMPVREAIFRLMAAGALTIVSGRSIGVPPLDREVFADLRNVRLEVEPVSLRWAMRNSSPQFHAELKALLHTMLEAEQQGEAAGFIRANYEFHFTLYRQAQSPVLLDIISNIWLRINPHFHLLQKSGHYKFSNDQHKAMVEGIVQGDEDLAVAALREDINSAYAVMLEYNGG